MLRRIMLPVIFVILAYGFWLSPNVKEICAGVAIFLFGMLFLEEGFRAFTGGLLEARFGAIFKAPFSSKKHTKTPEEI